MSNTRTDPNNSNFVTGNFPGTTRIALVSEEIFSYHSCNEGVSDINKQDSKPPEHKLFAYAAIYDIPAPAPTDGSIVLVHQPRSQVHQTSISKKDPQPYSGYEQL